MRRVPIMLATMALAFGMLVSAGARPSHAASLSDALLTAGDVGNGWTTSSAPSSSSDSGNITCGGEPLGGGILRVKPLEVVSVVISSPSSDPTFTGVNQEIARYAPGTASDGVAALNDLIDGPIDCKDGSTTLKFEPVDVPDLGDDVSAFKISAKAEGITVTGIAVFINNGDYLNSISYFSLSDTVKTNEVIRIAKIADKKLSNYLNN